MGNFNRDRNFDRGSSDRETFKATCADCGKFCELPFKPSNGRPVYCRDCFKKHSPDEGRGRDGGRGRDRFSRGGSNRGDREMFEATCANCGDSCKVPFRPTEGKDTLCSRCFEEKGGDSRRSTNGSAQQLTEINTKLDKILEILNFASEELEKEEAEAEPEEVIETVTEDVKASAEEEKPKKKAKKTKKKTAKKA